MIIFIFTFESFFMRTGADWPAVTGHWTVSRRVGFKFFIFPYIYVCVYMAGGAKLPRHPSPVTRLSQAGGGSSLATRPVCIYGGGVTRPAVTGRSTLSSRLRLDS